MKKQNIKNIGGSVGYDDKGNTYTRNVLTIQNKRIWGEWELNNRLGCSGLPISYYVEKNKNYLEIQKMCRRS